MPVLEKVFNQTLMLQEYTMSEGLVRGLVSAIPFIEENSLQRLFLDNCGITGDEFAAILDACQVHKVFRSIIYRMNGVSEKCIHSLTPFLNRRPPVHL